MNILSNLSNSFLNFISILRISDLIDVLLVAYLIYKAIKLVRETRAQQLVRGIIILVLLTVLSGWIHLNTINYILKNTMQFGVLALLVVFQPELRRALEKMGRSKFLNIFIPSFDDSTITISNEIVKAVTSLSSHKTGALIVLERKIKLGEILKSGTELNANITSELLINLFVPNTPLHDGAVIIRNNKIHSAACLLPLTQNNSLSRELGTRHRAALGVTEMSDAAVIVVSEETGTISFVCEGNMTRNLNSETLHKLLDGILIDDTEAVTSTINQWKERLKWKK